jgi:hypothetical protein
VKLKNGPLAWQYLQSQCEVKQRKVEVGSRVILEGTLFIRQIKGVVSFSFEMSPMSRCTFIQMFVSVSSQPPGHAALFLEQSVSQKGAHLIKKTFLCHFFNKNTTLYLDRTRSLDSYICTTLP